MKKTNFVMTLILGIVLAFSSVSFSKVLVDWSSMNGAIRATVKDHSALMAQTNAYKNDFYVVGMAVSNWTAGIYQAKINSPKNKTNWKLFSKIVATNYVGQVGATNTAFAIRTNVLHPIVVAEATNKSRISAVLLNVFYTNALHATFTNSISVQNSNRIMIRNYDRLTNWLLYVSNQTVKIKKK